jgi:hypothetical protein
MYPVKSDESIAGLIFFLLRETGIGFGYFLSTIFNNQLVRKKNGVQITRHKKNSFDRFSP